MFSLESLKKKKTLLQNNNSTNTGLIPTIQLTAHYTPLHYTCVLLLCRSPGRYCWGICVWPRRRVSVLGSSWCEERTWTRRGSWRWKRGVKIPSTRVGRTPMKGQKGQIWLQMSAFVLRCSIFMSDTRLKIKIIEIFFF